jgi:putative flippase GtrA
MIVLDMLMLYFLVQANGWKAVPASFLANTIAIIAFFIGNG